MEESFFYDTYNRLTEIGLGGVCTGTTAYDAYGRITSKTANGQPVFSGAVYDQTSKPHALDKAVTASGLFPLTPQTVSYTGFDKVGKVKMGNDSLVYTYVYGHQRIAMEEHVGNTVRTKRYVGACERVTETMGSLTTDRWLTYLTGPTGVYAVVVTMNGTNTLHYILKDNLGSWTTITDSDGVVEQRLSYDAWGNLRNPETWSGSFTGTPMFDRGFTGHEHLYNFGLINMKFTVSERSAKLCLSTAERCELGGANGRLYDPILGRMLSPDVVIQDEQSSQAYNRYSYCFNNPLRFTDPSGYVVMGSRNYYDWNSMVYYDFGNHRSNGTAFNTDLSEGKFSPIYDVNGYFLGTDDKGLQGEAIVMRREDLSIY